MISNLTSRFHLDSDPTCDPLSEFLAARGSVGCALEFVHVLCSSVLFKIPAFLAKNSPGLFANLSPAGGNIKVYLPTNLLFRSLFLFMYGASSQTAILVF